MASLKDVKVGDALVITRPRGEPVLSVVDEITSRQVKCSIWRFWISSGDGAGEYPECFARPAAPDEVERENQRQEAMEIFKFISNQMSRVYNLSLPTLREIKRLIETDDQEVA